MTPEIIVRTASGDTAVRADVAEVAGVRAYEFVGRSLLDTLRQQEHAARRAERKS